jgi:hypothetical protein
LDKILICKFCWERWKRRTVAKKMIAGDPMCRDCFSGRSGRVEEEKEVRARRRAAMNRPEVRARLRAAMKATWAKPEVRARRRAAMKSSRNSSATEHKAKV